MHSPARSQTLKTPFGDKQRNPFPDCSQAEQQSSQQSFPVTFLFFKVQIFRASKPPGALLRNQPGFCLSQSSRGARQLLNLTAVAKMERTPAGSRQTRREPPPSPSEPARAPPRRVAQGLLGLVVSARLPLDWQGKKGAGRSDALGSGAHLRAALASVLRARNTGPCASPAA